MLIRHWTHPTFGAVALGPAVSFRLPNFALGLVFEQISLRSQTLLLQWLLYGLAIKHFATSRLTHIPLVLSAHCDMATNLDRTFRTKCGDQIAFCVASYGAKPLSAVRPRQPVILKTCNHTSCSRAVELTTSYSLDAGLFGIEAEILTYK
jgi:hypothetical protein